MNSHFITRPLTALLSLCATTLTVQAAPSQPLAKPAAVVKRAPLATAQVDGVTVRVLRARWSENEEITGHRARLGKQLTVWFDAALDKIALPAGASAADYILNVRALNPPNHPAQVIPVNVVKSLHRPSMPYLPGKDGVVPDGQSAWRVAPIDPRRSEVRLEVEFLLPGHPFTRQTLPPSIIESEQPPAAGSDAARWLRKLSLVVNGDDIEISSAGDAAVAPLAQAENGDFKATLFPWRKSSSTAIGGRGVGRTHARFEAPLLVRTPDGLQKVALARSEWSGELRNEKGENLRVQLGSAVNQNSFWRPDGKMLSDAETYFLSLIEFDTTPSAADPIPDADSTWTLRLRRMANATREITMSGGSQSPALGEESAPDFLLSSDRASLQTRVRFLGTYDAEHPLQKLNFEDLSENRPPSGLLLITEASSTNGLPSVWKLFVTPQDGEEKAFIWRENLSRAQVDAIQKNFPVAEDNAAPKAAEDEKEVHTFWQAWVVPLNAASPMELRVIAQSHLFDEKAPLIEIPNLKPFAPAATK